ncbi:MAG: hypothetical protein ACU0C9_06715 [Paracoccaceae bacterium]
MNSTALQNSEQRPPETTNDYYRLPATEKQISYARKIAMQAQIALPWEVQEDRHSLSAWIDQHQHMMKPRPFAAYPSSKQVAFAERIARFKRRTVPQECFRDKSLMSRWIDGNR